MSILKKLGINTISETIGSLKAKVIEVFETASTYFCPLTDILKEDGFYTISNANGKVHGKVSNPNSVLAMDELIDIAYDVSIKEGLNLNFEDAELNYYRDESICTLNIPLGVSAFKTRNGFNDGSKLFLFIKTGFGGITSSEIGIFSYRFVCSNGQESRHGLNYFKAKHTEKMNEKAMTFLSECLPQMMNSVADFTKNAKKMDKADITKEQIEDFRQKMFNYKKDDEISTKKAGMIEAFNIGLKEEQKRAGVTAWTLLQGATNYTNHRHYNASNEFVVTGSGATFNAKAEKLCLELN